MKWILICVTAFAVCFGIGFAISMLLIRKNQKKRFIKRTILTIVSGLTLSLVCTFGYLGVYYKPQETALKALNGNEQVKVNHIKDGYYFDGPGSDTALIFYPGAKVKCEAYAPLMLNLAQDGIDCFFSGYAFQFCYI